MAMKGSRYQCSVGGRLGGDPRAFGEHSGVSVNIAVDLPVRRNGKTEFEAEWHQITAFGKLGEKLLDASKGQYVIVDGKKSFDEFTNKDTGEIVKKPNILASEIMFEYEDQGGGRQRRAPAQRSEDDQLAEDTGLY